MNLSSTSKYAIRILLFMALDTKKRYAATFLVEQLHISDKYLRQIMTQLSKAGLIESVRGREGGFHFTKPIESIFLIDIIQALESSSKYTGCILGTGHCSKDDPCTLHQQWHSYGRGIEQLLSETSLHSIINSGNIDEHKKLLGI